jgi:hypothetical protein
MTRGETSIPGLEGALFVDGAVALDVAQGRIGNCYFVAAVAALATQGLVEALFIEEVDGRIGLTFHGTVSLGNRVQPDGHVDVIRVDRALEGGAVDRVYGYSVDPVTLVPSMETWFPLLEKAYATWKGGYSTLAAGGWPHVVMAELMGRSAQCVALAQIREILGRGEPVSPERLVVFLRDLHTEQGLPLVLGTPERDQAGSLPPGFLEGHAYTVLGVESTGEPRLQLLEPGRSVEPFDDGSVDGIFEIGAETLVRCFEYLHYLRPEQRG